MVGGMNGEHLSLFSSMRFLVSAYVNHCGRIKATDIAKKSWPTGRKTSFPINGVFGSLAAVFVENMIVGEPERS
jgi:hypothetical protein